MNKTTDSINRTLSVAPMMACTDRHYRYFARLLSQHVLLYTEMVTAAAIVHGDQKKLLGFNQPEHPLALQVGGSDPVALVEAAKVAQGYGYDEINLNVGCPSDRVQAGRFGACLMKEPALVAECVSAMQHAVSIPVTVKTRIGVDDQDSYEALVHFIQTVSSAGCSSFALHARKAWLQGLSPRDNRTIPPLKYEIVHQVKRDFPQLEIIINGGIKTIEQIQQQLDEVDGVMIGREAYSNPWLLASFDELIKGKAQAVRTIHDVILSYMPYVARQLASGVKLRSLTRFLVGLFQGQPGARQWRRYLSEHAGDQARGTEVIESALQYIG